MPAVVGPVQLGKVSFSGVAGIGDRAFISPESSTKIITGSGGLSTGNYVLIDNPFDITTTFNASIIDEPMVKNN